MGNNSQPVRSANGQCPLVWPILLVILLLFFISAHYRVHAGRDANPAFNGYLDLTSAPSVGQTATLTLALESNLAETAKVEIVFRLPNGVSPQSPSIFSQVYLPAFSFIQRSLLIQVDLPGNYPLQASVYATTSSGVPIVDHFYLHLQTSPSEANVSPEPLEHNSRDLQLQTKVQIQQGLAAEGLMVQGLLTYFNDNERQMRPLQQVKVSLYQNQQELARTFANAEGYYRFETAVLNPNQPQQLHIVVKPDNRILTVVNRRWRTYELKSEKVKDVAEGQVTIDLTLDATKANRGLGNILDSIIKTHAFFWNQVGWERQKPIQVIWPGSGKVSYYHASQFGGRVTRETLTIAGGVDQWRSITMYHEYGHSAMMAAYGYNYNEVPRGKYQGGHRLETISDQGFAMSEGWAEFLEAAIDNRALNVTGRWEEQFPNIETNSWWTGSNDGSGENRDGGVVEGAVASILWDIFDTADSIDLTPDDDDELENRFDLLWKILIEDHPKTITDVGMGWRKRDFPQLAELEEIYATHHALSKPNSPPEFKFVSPAEVDVFANKSFQIKWEVSDPDNDSFAVDLYYDIDQNMRRANPIELGISHEFNSLHWNTVFVYDGKYYIMARVKDDRGEMVSVYSDSLVIIDHTPLQLPKIESPTHPDTDVWYTNSSPLLYFLTEPEVLSGRRYSFVLDHTAETEPDRIEDPLIRNNQLTLKGLNDGEWWLHLRAKDELDYWTEPTHFKLQIDSTPPPPVTSIEWSVPEIVSPVDAPAAPKSEIVLEWPSVQDVSSIGTYVVQVDVDSRDFSPQRGLLVDQGIEASSKRNLVFRFLAEGGYKYYARIKTVNGAEQESHWSDPVGPMYLEDFPKWDLNRDGQIDIMDLVYVARFFGQPSPATIQPTPDLNEDGTVNIFDVILVARHFGESAMAAPNLAQVLENLSQTTGLIDLLQQTLLAEASAPVAETGIGPNFPNPFNPETWIPYQLAHPSVVIFEIYNLSGQIIRRLDLGFQPAGTYQIKNHAAYWDGRTESGELAPSGIYFCRLQTDPDLPTPAIQKLTLHK